MFGALSGYLWYVIKVMRHLFADAGKLLPMLINVAGSGKKFVSQMKRYSPEFSYEYFSDKVVSILKMLVYSEKPQEVPYYVGEPFGNVFSDIIDSSYTGAVALKRFQVQEEYCYVTVDIYMDDIYDCGSSFNAAIQRSCPNCQTRYEIEDDDWTVLNIIKMNKR